MAGEFSENRRLFPEGEIMLLTLSGGLSTRDRSFPVYCDGLDDDRKNQIRRAIREKLTSFGARYTIACPEEAHVENIRKLADDLTDAFDEDLYRSRFRIGVSQKLLISNTNGFWNGFPNLATVLSIR